MQYERSSWSLPHFGSWLQLYMFALRQIGTINRKQNELLAGSVCCVKVQAAFTGLL